MPGVPNLLNDDGAASMATAVMMSHHAFRRDLKRLSAALGRIATGDAARAEAVREEWNWLRGALHAHHESEDHGIFPKIAAEHTSARTTIEKLGADHRRIDPLLEAGDRAFADLSKPDPALGVVRELAALLDPHLAIEESELIPFLRSEKAFPPPPNDEAAEMYAKGFAWCMHGIADDVLERVHEMLPRAIRERLPTARVAFAERCVRAWGTATGGSARTPIPTE